MHINEEIIRTVLWGRTDISEHHIKVMLEDMREKEFASIKAKESGMSRM